MPTYPTPQPGASLLLSFSAPSPPLPPCASASTSPHLQSSSLPPLAAPTSKFDTLLLLSPSRVSAVRAFSALEAGFKVVIGASILPPLPLSSSAPTTSASSLDDNNLEDEGSNFDDEWDEELLVRFKKGEVTSIPFNLPYNATQLDWTLWFSCLPSELSSRCMMICLGDTMGGFAFSKMSQGTPTPRRRRTLASAAAFRSVANNSRFMVNVADAPSMSDFSWPVTHRFDLAPSSVTLAKANCELTNGVKSNKLSLKGEFTPTQPTCFNKSPLQIALTTNSSACRLASRLKREIVSSLPSNIGNAVLAVANLRASLLDASSSSSAASTSASFEHSSLKRQETKIMDNGTLNGDNDEDIAYVETEQEEEEGETELDRKGTSLNRPVQQLSRAKSEGLDRMPVGKVESLTASHERAIGCRNKRSPSRSRGNVGRIRDESCDTDGGTRSEQLFIRYPVRLGVANFWNAFSSTTSTSTSTNATSVLSNCMGTAPDITPQWTALEAQRTRMRYVAQISEYWPLDRLASVSLASLSSPSTPLGTSPPSPEVPEITSLNPSRHSLPLEPPRTSKGRILLLGTGPGSTLLLTRLAYLFLTSPKGSPYFVDLFLTDKLVPSEIIALIPEHRRSGVIIARKFPGNAENAQDELMRLAVEGAKAGKTVLRMKQGDPFLYGRGGEEVLHFREAGFDPVVIPGLSSCLAGPTITGIPVTQRGVAESLVVCTGVGRGGREVGVEGYERGKTVVVLMGVARLESLVASLINHPKSKYPPHLPIALIERASSPDQRVISATVQTLSKVLAMLSPHRPPGMIVIGWGVMCLEGTNGKGDMGILDAAGEGDEADRKRVQGWLGESGYRVKDGLGDGWRAVTDGLVD